MTARPVVKWAGGKGRSAAMLAGLLPEKIRTYYEPMVGGGAVFFHLAAPRRFERAWLSDANRDLMVTYQQVRDNTLPLARRLSKIMNDRPTFESVRAQDPGSLSFLGRAARMIYLNKTCFNGLYRVNSKGKFNAPFGDYPNPTICDRENLLAARLQLAGVELTCADYELVVESAQPGDAVYFDPPYVPVKYGSFTAYRDGGFGSDEQIRLAMVYKRLARRGVAVVLSNSDTPFSRGLYEGFEIRETRVRRSINSDGAGRGEVGEIAVSANCGRP